MAGQPGFGKELGTTQSDQLEQYKNKLAQVQQAIKGITIDATSENIAAVTMTVNEFYHFHDSLAINLRTEHEADKIRIQTIWEESTSNGLITKLAISGGNYRKPNRTFK